MKKRFMIFAAAMLAVAAPAFAWHGKGHYDAARLAVAAASAADANLPAFLASADGRERIAHSSLDPDNFTHPIAPDALHRAEAPEHFFDVELLGPAAPADANFPPDRYAFIDYCYAHGIKPGRIGMLPYAVTEWTQRLTVALAEYRKYPDDPAVRAKCLVCAGMLAHYAADLCQPLHTTIHYDGRAGADAGQKSPRSGIHAKVDSLLGKLLADANTPPDWPRRDANAVLAAVRPAAMDRVLPAALAEIRRSHALVGRVYDLEKQLPPETGMIPAGSDVEKFAAERMRSAVNLTASLYLTAWRDSAAVKLPWWYSRPYNPPQKTGH